MTANQLRELLSLRIVQAVFDDEDTTPAQLDEARRIYHELQMQNCEELKEFAPEDY